MTTPHPPTSVPLLPTARQFLTSLFNAISEIPLVGGRNSSNPDESSSDESDDLPPRGASQEGGGGGQRRKTTLSRRRQRRLLLLQDGSGSGSVQGVGNITGPGFGEAGNVLKQVPVSHRHLIITLHVLFPGLVLPALDLLDRGLVGRIILQQQQQENTTVRTEERVRAMKSERGRQQTSLSGEGNIKAEEDGNQDGGGFIQPPAGGGNQKGAENEKEKPAAAASSFYLVRSAQPTSHHHRHRRRRQQQQQRSGYVSGGEEEEYPGGNKNGNNLFPGGQRAYIVRLDAWNCTCAAFAFASFSDPAEGEDITPTTTAKASREERASSSAAGTVTVTRNPGAAVDQEMENVRISSIISSTTGQGLANQEGGNQGCVDDRMDIDPPLPRAQEEMSEILPNTAAAAAETAATASGPNDEGDVGDLEEGWSFGGMSLSQRGDGDDSPPPPLCKHLLACLLAERWKDALGRYVVERQVSKEAMAGIVAEI